MKLEIEAKDAQAILDYLTSRPYREVFQFVAKLTALKPVASEEAKTEQSESA